MNGIAKKMLPVDLKNKTDSSGMNGERPPYVHKRIEPACQISDFISGGRIKTFGQIPLTLCNLRKHGLSMDWRIMFIALCFRYIIFLFVNTGKSGLSDMGLCKLRMASPADPVAA
jgi:hypothetical protein